jgi:amino acid transporter
LFGIIGVLILIVPIIRLAELTSYVTLAVFTVVNLSLWRISRRRGGRWDHLKAMWGLGASALTVGLLVADGLRRAGVFDT